MSTLNVFKQRLPAVELGEERAADILYLPFHLRQKTRQRAKLSSGIEIGIQLPRGTIMRGGDHLRAADGATIAIGAAAEHVSTASSPDATLVARAAYHLGNRHVDLQIGAGWVRYLHDHVLDAMVRALGLQVADGLLPFEPEGGAYGSAGGHDHEH